MSYLDVDRHRLRYLLSIGSKDGEISEFFKSCKSQLINSGAALHKLSDKKEARIDFLCRLSGKAADVYAKWIRSRLTIEQSILPEALIAQFKALERTDVKPDVEILHAHARLGLFYLYRDTPSPVWLTFLRSKIGDAREEDDEDNELESHEIATERAAPSAIVAALPIDQRHDVPNSRAISKIVEALETGHWQVDADPNGNSDWIYLSVAIARLWRDPDMVSAKALKAPLDAPVQNEISEQLVELRNSWLSRIRGPEGLALKDPQPVSILGDIDGDRVQVLGRCVSETATATAAFVEPYGLLVGDEVFDLDRDSARELFPATGQIIGFPGSSYPAVGEFGTFITERYQSGQPIKFRVRTRGSTAYTVIKLPASSSDPDAVRESLKALPGPLLNDALFKLSDGILLKTNTDERDLRHYNFDTPLLAWRKLSGWRVGDREIVLAPLPPADTRLDCSDLATVLKNIIDDQKAIEDWPKLTRANVRALIEYVRDQESLLSERRLRRLERELDTFVQSREGLEAVVNSVLQSDQVRSEFESAKQNVVREYEASRADLLKGRQGLENDLKQLKAAKLRLQDDTKKMASEVATAVSKAFEKAQSNGLESLANVALFQALIGGKPALAPEPMIASRSTDSRISVEHFGPRAEAAEDILRHIGIRTAEARSIAALLREAAAVGLSIGLQGTAASYIGKRLAAGFTKSHCAIVDVYIGKINRLDIVTALSELGPEVDLVLFRAANYSDFSAYGVDIESELLDKLSGDISAKSRTFMFSFENGPAALPVPRILRQACLILDLDWLSRGPQEVSVDGALIEERMEASKQIGVGKLKIEAIRKLTRSLESKEGIGEFWMNVVHNNLSLDSEGVPPN